MTSAYTSDISARSRHVVTAVLVAHDGERWLPTTLAAVKGQRRPVQRFVAVDTGSLDGTLELLERAAGPSSVMEAPRETGFAAAAHRAVAAFATAPGLPAAGAYGATTIEWIWLLHDDSAPAPGALEALLELADEMPSVGVIGPKLLDWTDRRTLLEVGVTIDRGGRRETGLDPGELDQGQHDSVRDVLAVSTAGMLVRRDVWNELGGLDQALPLFRDDLDFGWRANLAGRRVVVCPSAVVYHAAAAAAGVRPIDTGSPFRRRLDRQAALRTMLVNCAGAWLPWIAVRLLLACVVRSLMFLLVKRPYDAWDELCAAARVFSRPRALLAARKHRKAIRTARPRDVRSLLAPPGVRIRHYVDTLSQRLALVASSDDVASSEGRPDGGARTSSRERGLARRVVTHPGVLLVMALLVVALIAERHVLGGALFGGALLPAPRGASDLWRAYTESWHPTGFGSTAGAPPYLALLAILATVLFGSARLAVQVLLLGAVPLAGLTAYLAARPIAPQRRVRVWVAATYALLPVATGSIAAGRLGVAVVFIVLPLVLATMARALLPPLAKGGPAAKGTRPAWAAAIMLTIAAAFDPAAYVLLGSIALLALIAGLARRSFVEIRRAVVLLAVPPVLLLPWTLRLVRYPALIIAGVGQQSPDLQSATQGPLDVLLLDPGGPGMPPVWLYAVVVLAGFAGLLQLTRPGPARLGWLLAFAGLIGGLVISKQQVKVPGAVVAAAGWPGTATALIGAGVLMSAAVAGARLRARLATVSFGWRQPVALVMAAAAVATPVVAAGLWLAHGTGSRLQAGAPEVLPAFIRDPAATHDEPRTIVLHAPDANGVVSYALLRDRSPQLGDADLPPDPAQVAVVDAAVSDLAGGFGLPAATELAHAGVRYVLVPLTGDGGLRATIAQAGGLVPKATDARWQVWQVVPEAGRVAIAPVGDGPWRVATGGASTRAAATLVGRDAGPVVVPYSTQSRDVVLAEAPSSQWQARATGADGVTVPLQPTTRGGMQAFMLPPGGSDVVVYREPGDRAGWLIFELVAAVLVLGAAIPAGRRSADQQRPARRVVATSSTTRSASGEAASGEADRDSVDNAVGASDDEVGASR